MIIIVRRKGTAVNVATLPDQNRTITPGFPDQNRTITPRVDGTGNPVQFVQYGLCKNPGCQYPKRVENGTIHDFCSRTCASKLTV